MTAARWSVAGLFVVGAVVMSSSPASADEGDTARDKGISVSAWAASALDRSVTTVELVETGLAN